MWKGGEPGITILFYWGKQWDRKEGDGNSHSAIKSHASVPSRELLRCLCLVHMCAQGESAIREICRAISKLKGGFKVQSQQTRVRLGVPGVIERGLALARYAGRAVRNPGAGMCFPSTCSSACGLVASHCQLGILQWDQLLMLP